MSGPAQNAGFFFAKILVVNLLRTLAVIYAGAYSSLAIGSSTIK